MQRGIWQDSPLALIRRFLRDDSGATAVIVALMLPVLTGMAALALDVGIWTLQKRQAQGAADQAAYSAAVAGKAGGDWSTEGKAIAATMGFNAASGATVTPSYPPADGTYAGNTNYWEVKITQPQHGLFAVLTPGFHAPTVVALAVAGGTSLGNGCVIALSTSASPGILIDNNGSVTNSSCGMYSNANNSSSIKCGSGNSGVCVFGGQTYTPGSNQVLNGTKKGAIPTSNQHVLPTAFSASNVTKYFTSQGVPTSMPSASGCANNTIYSNLTVSSSSSLSAGAYCISGSLTFSDSQTINLTGVTFILGPSSTINTFKAGTINMTAPTTGTYANIAILDFASAVELGPGNNGGASCPGGSCDTFKIKGIIYAPNGSLTLDGGTTFDPSVCTQLIGQSVTLKNNINMGSSCPALGSGGVGNSTISLVQ